ncbi:AAA family ATPase [filamentous cyanobacterium CCP2]|nr:AAA family ATPase [filamentous cyanobacterium CCP2]
MSDRFALFQEAYRNLDLLPLLDRQDLERFRVKYREDVIEELQQLVEDDDTQSGKTIFSGHRGCGKSTLLAEFGRQCRERNFFVVFFSIADLFESPDVTHTNILYAIAVSLIAEAEREGVELSKQLKEPLYRWFTTRTRIETDTPINASLSAGFDFKFIQGILKSEANIREEIRQEFEPKISDLVARINIIAAQIQVSTKKRVLVIIDDLDKIDLGDVEKIFKNHIKALFLPGFRIIYTIPVSSLREASLRAVLVSESNDQIVVMPVSKLFSRGERRKDHPVPIDEAVHTLCEILQKRISAELIEPDLVTQIVLYSGGVLRELIRISNICCRLCLREIRRNPNQTVMIDQTILVEAIKKMRLDFEQSLSKADYEILKNTYDRFMPDDPKAQEFLDLLHGLHVLEYRNGDIWYDLHPIVIDLLKLKGLVNAT